MTFLKNFLSALFALGLTAAVAACSDDFGRDYESTSERIIFASPQFRDPDSVSARGVSEPELVDVIALEAADGSDSLFFEIYAEPTPSEVEPTDDVQSRGEKVDRWTAFSLFGYKYKASDGWSANLTPDFAYNDIFTISGNKVTPPKEYFWPGSKYNLRFFAVMPDGEGTPNAPDVKGYPTLDYTVPTDLDEQKDILVGKSGELKGNYYKDVKLSFSHPLSTICFKTDNTPNKFYSNGSSCGGFYSGNGHELSICNVYGRAVYNLDKGVWTDHSELATYTMDLKNTSLSGLSEQSIAPSNSSKIFFFVVPQTAPDGAMLKLKYTDKETGTERTFTGSLAGIKWEPGKTYTYKIATSSIKVEYFLEVDDSECNDLPYEGGNFFVKINSYKTITREGDEPKRVNVAWTTTIAEKYNTVPWTTLNNNYNFYFQNADANTVSEKGCKVTIHNMTHSRNLKTFHMEPARRYEGLPQQAPYNLATGVPGFDNSYNPIQNTANCYVVDDAGWICFPAVFGPTFKDRSVRDYGSSGYLCWNSHDFNYFNSSNRDDTQPDCPSGFPRVLHPTAAIPMKRSGGTKSLKQYNTNDETIRDYINYYGTGEFEYNWSGFTAKLDWVDSQGQSIDRVELIYVYDITHQENDQNRYYIRFYSYGNYCNAVISLYDNTGDRVWSWHIWCTDQLNSSTDQTVSVDGRSFKMASVDLGWVPEYTYTCHSTDYRLQFTQKESQKKVELTFNQSTDKEWVVGRRPVWQFGRPTPYPYGGICYDEYGNKVNSTASSVVEPTLIERLYDNLITSWERYSTANEQSYINIWSWENYATAYTSDPVVKSLYDPCPIGYCMPPGLLFNAFGFDNIVGPQPNQAGVNHNSDPSFANVMELYTDSQHNNTASFYRPETYLTSQGFVTFDDTDGDTFTLYHDTNGKPYLEAQSPTSVLAPIRPVREQ